MANGYMHTLPKELSAFIVDNEYIKIASGDLCIKKGYAWDGPSGPTIDTKNFMRGSLVHDALYQLLRENELPPTCRKFADLLLKDICRKDGMSWIRAQWVYLGVKLMGKKAASTSCRKEIQYAPGD